MSETLLEFDPNNPNIITPDSKLGKRLGFTSDKFEGYLTKHSKLGIISLTVIKSLEEHKGNVKKLLDKLILMSYSIDAVTVSARMRSILLKYGFKEGKTKDYLLYLNPNVYSTFERDIIYESMGC